MTLAAGARVSINDFGSIGPVDLASLVETGYASSGLSVSRVGQTVFWDGIVTPATDWGAANTLHLLLNGDVPLEYRPAASSPLWTQPSAGGTASVQFRVGVSSAGNLQIRCNTASNTGGVYLSMVYRGAPL